jgi:exodeoxyribonuclease VII large subunit
MQAKMDDVVLSVSDFVAVLNQTLEFAYPNVTIAGELANFRVSKNRWVYFDLKDELASVKFFGTVYQLPGPLEDGMTLQVRGMPRLHPNYGFSVTIQALQPIGEGTIRRAAALLQAKLEAEGLFDSARKRPVPYAPNHIGLIASSESAAYADFIKILNARWVGVQTELADVQVQGETSPAQIIRAIEYFNQSAEPPEVLVITRGGGSPEDLAAFSTEQVTRAVAASRIPTLVAIGHEVDISLAELAADQRASTPSNAAELLVPDKRHVREQLTGYQSQLASNLQHFIAVHSTALQTARGELSAALKRALDRKNDELSRQHSLLVALSPHLALRRGYAVIRSGNLIVNSVTLLKERDHIAIQLQDGTADASITSINVAS